jgi:predicted acylesterase/phospholipase RssA
VTSLLPSTDQPDHRLRQILAGLAREPKRFATSTRIVRMQLSRKVRRSISMTTHLPKALERTGDRPMMLIMKGGGVKGLAYVGALAELSKYYTFTTFVGTSAGAVTAALLAAGYSVHELEEILQATNFKSFFDARLFQSLVNLFVHGGLYRAEVFTHWLNILLAEKLKSQHRIQMSDLPYSLIVYACRREKATLVYDSEADGNVSVAYAVRCSMSIPFVFIPEKNQGMSVFDGGVKDKNYPVEELKKIRPDGDFIGLYLGPRVFTPQKTRFPVVTDLLNILFEASDTEALNKYRDHTVVIDPSPISTLDFNLKEFEKNFLILEGRAAALEFLTERGLSELSERSIIARKEAEIYRTRVKRYRKRRRQVQVSLIVGSAVLLLSLLIVGMVISVRALMPSQKSSQKSYLFNQTPEPVLDQVIRNYRRGAWFMDSSACSLTGRFAANVFLELDIISTFAAGPNRIRINSVFNLSLSNQVLSSARYQLFYHDGIANVYDQNNREYLVYTNLATVDLLLSHLEGDPIKQIALSLFKPYQYVVNEKIGRVKNQINAIGPLEHRTNSAGGIETILSWREDLRAPNKWSAIGQDDQVIPIPLQVVATTNGWIKEGSADLTEMFLYMSRNSDFIRKLGLFGSVMAQPKSVGAKTTFSEPTTNVVSDSYFIFAPEPDAKKVEKFRFSINSLTFMQKTNK